MNETAMAAHRGYMARDRAGDAPIDLNENCVCEECGCEGNCKCGHECLNEEEFCTMDGTCVCPCCKAVWKADREARDAATPHNQPSKPLIK